MARMGLEQCLLLGMRGASSFVWAEQQVGGSGDEASGQGGGNWGQVGGLTEWEQDGVGTAVTRGTGPGLEGTQVATLSSRSVLVPCRHTGWGAAGACGCFRENGRV